MGTIYDENGGRYEVNGNYLLPCLTTEVLAKIKLGCGDKDINAI